LSVFSFGVYEVTLLPSVFGIPTNPASSPMPAKKAAAAVAAAPISDAQPSPLGELRDETWRAKNRPDNLFGSSVVEDGMRCFVLLEGAEGGLVAGVREVTMNHALMQIVREMVMNCTDLVERDPEFRKVSVSFDSGSGCITVRNDGRGIPVGKDLIAIADETRRAALQGLWSPTLLLARWGCSSNYDDSQVRFTAGKNGLGAKAVLAWCSRVEVRAVDSVRQRSFEQSWQDGMRVEAPAKVKEGVTRKGFTEVKMWPDYAGLVRMSLPLSPEQVGALRWCVWECSTVLPRGNRFGVSIDGCSLPDHTAEGMMRAVLSLCTQPDPASASSPASVLSALLRTAAPLRPAPPTAAVVEDASSATDSVSRAPPLIRADVSWPPHQESLTGFAFPTHALVPHLSSLLPAIGFVNGVPCPRGTHRQRWESALSTDLNKKLGEKVNLTRGGLLGTMVVAVSARINQPKFGSQTKDELVTRLPAGASLAGSVPLAPLVRSGLFAFLKAQHSARAELDAVKAITTNLLSTAATSSSAGSRRRYDVDDVDHYEGAELAGRSRECFLFLTEGLSAQNCARNVIARLTPELRRTCGSFALRGKLINAMSNPATKVLANKEVQGLLRICNLNPSLTYESVSERAGLRYGKLILWTDADTDGGHIAWLVFLLVYKFWPRLATAGYVERFVTPLLKVLDPRNPQQFYSEAARDRWLEQASAGAAEAAKQPLATADMRRRALDESVSARGVKVKYYKGLGRLMAEDEKDLAARFHKLRIRLEIAAGEETLIDSLGADDADTRRSIQLERDIRALPYDDIEQVSISEFVEGELLPYMRDANLRQIPGIDGFVEVSRMIVSYFYTVPSAASPGSEHVVARLAAAIAAKMDYHHGEASMAGAIATMAQDFAGKNNMNLLEPRGQFGERSEPTPGQPRYTNTALQTYTKTLFPSADYPALPMPRHGEVPCCMPGVIPMLLVNGATGIGYGHSTEIPPHDPRDVARLCCSWLDRHRPSGLALDDVGSATAALDPSFIEECAAVLPWVRGLGRQPERAPDGSVESRGRAELSPDLRMLTVTELPAGVWSKNARASMAKLPWLAAVYMHPRITSVLITAEVPDPSLIPADVREEVSSGCLNGPALLRALRLVRKFSYSNMKAFDRTGRLRSFGSIAELLHDFALLRLWIYARRRELELSELARETTILRGKVRFIELQLDSTLDLRSFPDRPSVYEHLARHHAEDIPAVDGHRYLDGLSLWNLTQAEVDRLRAKSEAAERERAALEATTPADMWRSDLGHVGDVLAVQWRSGPPPEDAQTNATAGLKATGLLATRKRGRAGGSGR
jgi:DNA topoisomerase II